MELCEQNLLQLLNKRFDEKGKGFDEEKIYEIMKQLNNAFTIMKRNNIIHTNLKLENILIKYSDEKHKKYTVKISDYGCSKRLIPLSRKYNTYKSPEILKKEEYNEKCDLCSIGIIIYRLIFGKSPYWGDQDNLLIKNIYTYGNKIIKKTQNKDLDD